MTLFVCKMKSKTTSDTKSEFGLLGELQGIAAKNAGEYNIRSVEPATEDDLCDSIISIEREIDSLIEYSQRYAPLAKERADEEIMDMRDEVRDLNVLMEGLR